MDIWGAWGIKIDHKEEGADVVEFLAVDWSQNKRGWILEYGIGQDSQWEGSKWWQVIDKNQALKADLDGSNNELIVECSY